MFFASNRSSSGSRLRLRHLTLILSCSGNFQVFSVFFHFGLPDGFLHVPVFMGISGLPLRIILVPRVLCVPADINVTRSSFSVVKV